MSYRNLVLPHEEIEKLVWKWIVFPIATFHMKNREKHSFIIFNKHRFKKWYNQIQACQGSCKQAEA